jgi:hypothetical protein
MSWIDQNSEAGSTGEASRQDLARHLRWLCGCTALTLLLAAGVVVSRSIFMVIPFVVSCFFTGRQWMEWLRAKRQLAASPAASSKNASETEDSYRCSFCGKSQAEVTHLISSPKDSGTAPAHICDRCVEMCNSILSDLRSGKSNL